MSDQPHIVSKVLKSGIVWYIYAWRGGPQVRRSDGPKKPRLTPNDWAVITSLRAEALEHPVNTVGQALTAYRASRDWKRLAKTTQKTWGTALDRIEARWGKFPLSALDSPKMKAKIVNWRDDMEATPRTADISVLVLSRFFNWACLNGHMDNNPAQGIPTIYKQQDRAPIVWLDDDLAAIRAESKQALRDAIDLAALTGLRRDDLVKLRWDEVHEAAIRKVAIKSSGGKRYSVTVPRLPELSALLEELRTRPRKPGVETVLVNSFGKSWTGDGLNSSFHEARAKANRGEGIWYVERDPGTGLETRTKKRLHDLRGTFATRIMAHPTAKLTDREVADIMGWSVEQVAKIRKRYVDDGALVVSITHRLAEPV